MLRSAKANAKTRGLEFNLTEDDLIFPEKCPYLDIELVYTHSGVRKDSKASLDRIDNSKGYIPGNVQIISDLANRMKTNATKEQLILFARSVLKFYNVS